MYGAVNRNRAPNNQTITTTLYHLIAGLQDHLTADNDDLLVAVVHRLLGTGRIKLLRDCHGKLNPLQRRCE